MPELNGTSFANILSGYVNRLGFSYGQLAHLTGLPKRTLAHWIEGGVARPRDWRDLLKIAATLRLDEAEVTLLLISAQHADIVQLLAQADNDADRRLLAPWSRTVQHRLDRCPFQVIADLPHFVGRDHEIYRLRQVLLGKQAVKLCSVHGMAGSGKTALAVHLAYLLRPYFQDGVLWACLDHADPMSTLSSFARAYGVDVREYKDIESRSRVVRELLAHKRALIILDNVETSDQAQPLLPPSGVCAVLLTSRRHDLSIARGAYHVRLGPFDRKEDSLHLFANIIGEERVQKEQDALAEIAAQLGHLPLALDIAASRMAYEPDWSAVDFLARLQRETGRMRLNELIFENQNVRLSFGLSFQRLSTSQQNFFQSLGALGGEDFGAEVFASIHDLEIEKARDSLRHLSTLSLVQMGRPGRYSLHPLLRDLAIEAGVTQNQYRKMASFYLQFIETHRENYAALDVENSSLPFALETARQNLPGSDFIQAVDSLTTYLDVRGLYVQAELLLGHAVQIAETLKSYTIQAALLCKLGLALIHSGRLEAAQQHLLKGLELSRADHSSADMTALFLGYLGMIAYYRCEFESMEKYLQESLSIAQASCQEEVICQLLDGLNGVSIQRGEYFAAEAYARQGLVLANRLENRELLCLLLKSLATAIFERGGSDAEIEAYLQESLSLARDLGYPRILCETLLSIGYIFCGQGRFEQAETCLQEALQLLQTTDFPLPHIFILSTLGLAAGGRGMFAQATAYLQEGITLAHQTGISVLKAPLQNAWGWLYFKQCEWDAAIEMFSQALALSRKAGMPLQMGQALYGLARVARAQGDQSTASRLGSESLEILEKIGHRTRQDVDAWLNPLG